VSSRLVVNLADAAVTAAIAGAGIARVLSDQVAEPLKSGALVRLLEAFEPTPMPASLVYPRQRLVPLKLRAFLDFATPRLRQRLGYENP
jgi:DNA-binding transcriptional LysR family regulator